jgi:predicted transcriptional regulator
MSAGYAADPSFRKIGSQHLEGLIVHTPSFPHRLYQPDWVKRTLDQCKKEYSDEAWIGQELSFGWLMVPVMAEILERAKSTKAIDIRKVAHEIDLQNIPATSATVNQGMAFDERGRVVEKYQGHVILKYIDGIPRVVYPPNLATHKASWVGK